MADARIEEIRSLLPRTMLPDWVRLGSRLVRLLRDQHHADAHDAVVDRLLARARDSVALREERRLNVPALSYPPDLPITPRKDDIVAAIRANQVVIVAGETGSGKTTQIPKMCLEAGLGIEAKIGCTQPRRIAAQSISRRIAEELNVTWGREVGCKIRFDDHSSPQTYIKLMTDGILLAETQGDPLLCEYNAIIIDEAHERSLNIDFLLGCLKGLLVKRPALKLVITSATIDTEAFSKAFGNAPIIDVSGRLYPVEVAYVPFDAASEESGDMTCIDAAVRAVEQVLAEPGGGDVLVFMPGERDIRETTDLLTTRLDGGAEIVPLFGRLASGDQQRVFAPASRRKIVVATNIAETSLTIPGIRYVIDSGLARISRYNARTRIKRLPVEAISQSSANQRKGRAGRVRNGVCIRLYAEAEFTERPPYTQPEIQRANLAEVILRMKAFRLGEIETFPFINPPSPAAVQAGYNLLLELGALDDARSLTPLGRDLAHLPIDPTLGRMLLQSQHEHATRELLIIAAGLSIPDPRERPLEQKETAAAVHKRFADPRSDFLTLLNLWNAVHDRWETLRSQNQRRKFCKANFLSYMRMREWQDLYAQLYDALDELGTVRLNESNAAYEAIHRSILSGLLGHVACRTERNLYKTAGNRLVTIFPGSALFNRVEKVKKAKPAPSRPEITSTNQPEWVMAGEIVETSQVFARTVAGIDPLWILELAPHLCRTTYSNPRWSAADGQVVADEKTTLYGLEVRQRKAAYGNVNPKEATEIFIRSALVEEDWSTDPPEGDEDADGQRSEGRGQKSEARGRRPKARDQRSEFKLQSSKLKVQSSTFTGPSAPPRYPFLEHNRQVRQKIETWQTRMRRHDLADLDQALFDFYARHIENVSSLYELNRLLGDKAAPDFLCATEADLAGDLDLHYDAAAFPDAVSLGSQPVLLSYAYTPGEEQDGVTLKLPFDLALSVSPAAAEWAVPGLREGQIAELLRALPKAIRRQLMPFPPKVAEILRDLHPGEHSLKHDLAKFIRQHYGIEVSPSVWPADALAQHLQPRIEIVGTDHKTLAAGRDLEQLRSKLEKAKVKPVGEDPAWARAALRWERFGLNAWTFEDLPDHITITETAPGDPQRQSSEKDRSAVSHDQPAAPGRLPDLVYAWPGLQLEEDHVNLRLFRSQDAARHASLAGIQYLVELAIQKDLGWLQKDLRALSRLEPFFRGLCAAEELQAAAFTNLKRHVLPAEPFVPLTAASFHNAVETARQRLPGLAPQLSDRVEAILKLRQEIARRYGSVPSPSPARPQRLTALTQLAARPSPASPPSPIAADLEALLPKNFLETISFERLPHIPRYLKALLIRAERAALNPLKDQERARQLAPYQDALRTLQAAHPASPTARQNIEGFRWMLEEYRVSLFAQELGTAMPVSPKRLDQHLQEMRDV